MLMQVRKVPIFVNGDYPENYRSSGYTYWYLIVDKRILFSYMS